MSWTGEDWCRALEGHFFTKRVAGLPVLFLVDEDVLVRLMGGNAADAVDSIAEVVTRRLGRPGDLNGYFYRVERQGRQWKLAGGDGCPPFLDLLAVCVLAATRMGAGEYAANNYYAQLRDLLNIAEPGTPRGFDGSLDYLWSTYTWWLDERLDGARGISTVIENAPFTHVGRPLSQTLFLGSDIKRLDEFFRWMQLDPDEDVDDDVLVLYFRAWAPGRRLSRGAERLLADAQFWPTLGRILGAYAHHWDGTRFDRESTRTAELRVLVRLRPPRGVSLQALQPEGYPERLAGQLGGSAVFATAEDGVFVVNATEPRQLLRGGMLGDGTSRLTLHGGELYVLQLDVELGGWSSVSSFVPGERHYVLAAPSVADQVLSQLRRACTEPPSIHELPGGFGSWGLFGDVVVQGDATLEGVLAERRPTLRHRFVLRGGLPLSAGGSYLSGGAPDVWLPSATQGTLSLTLDGERVETLAEQVRLADYLPGHETRSHVVGYGGVISRTIAMIESHLLVPPPHEQPGHALELGELGEPLAQRTLGRVDDANERDIVIVGPHVHGPGDSWSEAPVMLRRHADQAWLLGNDPSEVIAVAKPPKPAWMVKQGLTGHLYEARAPFPVQYSVERWPSGELKARQRGSSEPGDLATNDEAVVWARLLLDSDLTDGDLGIWREYQAAAELVHAEVSCQ